MCIRTKRLGPSLNVAKRGPTHYYCMVGIFTDDVNEAFVDDTSCDSRAVRISNAIKGPRHVILFTEKMRREAHIQITNLASC
jgi:hypothetical protein